MTTTYIRSRRLNPVTAAAAAALTVPLALHAQQATPAADNKAGTLPAVTVKAAAESAAPIKTDRLDSPKFTQPLLDTPQTVQVFNKELLQQQGIELSQGSVQQQNPSSSGQEGGRRTAGGPGVGTGQGVSEELTEPAVLPPKVSERVVDYYA